jgi:DNA-binding IclR family transcriptional regulator
VAQETSTLGFQLEPEGPAAIGRQSVVFRVLDLIQLVAESAEPMTLAEIGVTLHLPKPTVHRLCTRLEQARYLSREPGRNRYRLGLAVERLAFNALRHGTVHPRWRAILARLAEENRLPKLE